MSDHTACAQVSYLTKNVCYGTKTNVYAPDAKPFGSHGRLS